MIKESVTIDDAIDLLNEALKLDPQAIGLLVSAHVGCNEDLSNHPTVQVMDNGPQKEPRYGVGILGILNGIFGTYEDDLYGPITAVVDQETRTILKFRRTRET